MSDFTISVFKNTGLYIKFVPLFITLGSDDIPLTNHEMAQYGLYLDASYQFDTSLQIDEAFSKDFIKRSEDAQWEIIDKDKPYLRSKSGSMAYKKAGDANEYTLWGFWLALETNTGDASRGYVISSRKPNPKEIGKHRTNPSYRPIQSPYLFEEEDITIPLNIMGKLTVNVHVNWRKSNQTNVQNVDLILDLGNTRTCAVLLEEFKDKPIDTLKSLCKPLPLDDSMISENILETAIVPSWFITHQALFDSGNDDNQDTYMVEWKFTSRKEGFLFKKVFSELITVLERHPQMFVRNSLIKIGEEARKIYSLENIRDIIIRGMKMEQSSPKRYYWDVGNNEKGNQNAWSMVLNGNKKAKDGWPASFLKGELLRFLPVDGSILNFDEFIKKEIPFPIPDALPAYPRATTITLFLYDMLEKAWASINDSVFSSNDMFKRRRLNKLIATFPSAWSIDEIETYKKRFLEAIEIFHIMNFDESEPKIQLEMDLDEGAASQLPIVLSEIHKLHDDYTGWIEQNSVKGNDYVRVMNIDIGGGTTDLAIIEYGQLDKVIGAVAIHSSLIFRDGFNIAGDDLMKRIIEKMILPVLAHISHKPENVWQLLKDPNSHQERIKRVQFVKLCLMPLAVRIMQMVDGDESMPVLDPIEIGIAADIWGKFEIYLGIPADSGRFIPFLRSEVQQLVDETFTSIFSKSSDSVSEHNVDIVIISGKTSELPQVRNLAERHLQGIKIISTGQYEAGAWYPFGIGGKIADAKSVTAVGAALYSAIANGMLSTWSIQFDISPKLHCLYEWNVLSEWEKSPSRAGFMSNEDTTAEVTLLVNSIIARRQAKGSKIEPRYKLVWKNAVFSSNWPIRVMFEKSTKDHVEYLTIKSALFSNNSQTQNIKAEDLELIDWYSVDTEYTFWQDSGVFTKQDELDQCIKDYMSKDENSSKSQNDSLIEEEKFKQTPKMQSMKLLHNDGSDSEENTVKVSRSGRRKSQL